MYTESRVKAKPVPRAHKFIYVFSSIAIIVLKLVNISLVTWFRYCWWNFGLLESSSFTTFKNFKNESFIADVQNDSCGSLRSLTEYYCPYFCDRVMDFTNAGICMLFFGSISAISEMLCLAFHVWNFFKKSFRFEKIWAVIAIPRFLYVLGFSMWIGIIKPNSIHKILTGYGTGEESQTKSFQLLQGFYLANIIIALDLVLMVYGLVWTRREFLGRNKS